MNQPTAIGLASVAVVLAGAVIWWTVRSNTTVPPPPITAGISGDPTAKTSVAPMSTSPGMSLNVPGH